MQQNPGEANYPPSSGQNPQSPYQPTPYPQANGPYRPMPPSGGPYQPTPPWQGGPYQPPNGSYQSTPYPPALPNGPYQPTPQPPMTPFPPKKSRKGWKIVGIIVGVLFLIGIIANIAQPSTKSTPTPTQQTQATSVPQAAATQPGQSAPPKTTEAQFGDGTYTVGKDIQAGTYRTRQGSPGCYFARLKGFGGTVDDIIANDNTDDPAIVTIAPGDKGFQATNCGTWTKDLSAITTSKTTFTDGMFIIGTDIQSGTYKSSGQSGCYYARLSGFGGTISDIIANDNTDTAAIVTISSSDKGFQSKNCGTWTKQ